MKELGAVLRDVFYEEDGGLTDADMQRYLAMWSHMISIIQCRVVYGGILARVFPRAVHLFVDSTLIKRECPECIPEEKCRIIGELDCNVADGSLDFQEFCQALDIKLDSEHEK